MNTRLDKYIIRKNVPFFEAYYRFYHNNSRKMLLVTDNDDRLLGVIGMKEIEAVASRSDANEFSAIDIANKNHAFIYNEDNYRSKALKLFYENGYGNIPVITQGGVVVEMFSRIDFHELRMTSYAFDSGEDVVLAFALRDTENIFYIDVGAFDPMFASVTKHFYDNGACGINIEPLKKQYDLLCEVRRRDININAICSDCDDVDNDFYICHGGGSSTVRAEYALQDAIKSKVKSVSLRNVVAKHLPENQTVHFLKIDVEGYEKQVLYGMDFSRNRPWIIVLEATDPKTNAPTHDIWEHILLENGYIFARQYSVNRFYVDASLSGILLPRFIDFEKMCHRLIMSNIKLNINLSYI